MYSTIVVPVDLGHPELGSRTLAVAREIGGEQCRIVALHVAEGVPPYIAAELPREPVRQQLAAAHAALAVLADEVKAEAVVRSGYPPLRIIEFADQVAADLIVLDPHRFEPEDYLLGSLATRVMRLASCPVLVCPTLVSAPPGAEEPRAV